MRSVLADRAMMLFGRGKRGGRGGQEEGVNSWGDGGDKTSGGGVALGGKRHMIDESDEEEEKGQEAVYYDGVNSI